MLAHLREIEKRNPDGSVEIILSDPDNPLNWIEDPCAVCGGESSAQVCPACDKMHHHGRVHRLIDGEYQMIPLCGNCGQQ